MDITYETFSIKIYMSLKEILMRQNKTRWLDIGCGRNFEEGFLYLDKLPKKIVKRENKAKYFKINLLNTTNHQLSALGKFNFIRMQHVLEHFSFEEGLIILHNVAKLLKKDGIILITVPDLKINLQKYTKKAYKTWKAFNRWAWKRIPKNAPESFYFSVFAYSLPATPHKWCYDYEGLKYILKATHLFKSTKRINLNNKLASVPFTHSRPEEDLCIMAKKFK